MKKLDKEEIEAIRCNLIAIGCVTRTYNLLYRKIELKINKIGLRLYATILMLLGENKILNGPKLTTEKIELHTFDTNIISIIYSQRFVDYTPLDEKSCALTERGAQHIIVMFDLNKNNITKLVSKLGL